MLKHPITQKLLQPHIIISAAAALAVVAIGTSFAYTARKPSVAYVAPTMGAITQEVDTTGTVKAADTLDLSFESGGRIAYVNAVVGTHVALGTTLARLSSADLQAELEQAQAALQAQEAKLDGLVAGSRPESIAVTQSSVSAAQTSVSQSKASLVEAVRDAYVKSDDAIHNKVDQFFSNPQSVNPVLNFTISDSQLQSTVQSGRIDMEGRLTKWRTALAALPSSSDAIDVTALSSMTADNLNAISSYLTNVALALSTSNLTPSAQVPVATIQKYQGDIATARSNISTALSTLNTVVTAEKAAESGLGTAQSELTLTMAPATASDIAAQKAQVAAAQANVDAVRAQIGNGIISAPISGTITRDDAHVGETAAPGAPLISLISDTKFQIEAYVSEADISKLKEGDTMQVKLDAYPDAVFSAHIISLDPAATVQNGVAAYKVVGQFDADDAKILAGLTGNITIQSDSKPDVLTVPSSAIITRGADQFVLKASPAGDEMVKVQTGIESPDGQVEIVSGLSASDKIRAFGAQ